MGRSGLVYRTLWSLLLWAGGVTDSFAADETRYIVRFTSNAAQAMSAKSLSSHAAIKEVASKGVTVERVLPLDNSVVLKLSPPQRDALAARSDVESIEVDGKIHAFFEPDDTAYPELYGLHGTYGISAPRAWDISVGATTKIVAVLDSGIDFDHEDLQGNIWTNPAELAENNRDDDGNGFVDDSRGYDFGSDIGDSDPSDENGHGTHVSGIIAATGNNTLGVIGVAWQTSIVPVKCLDDAGNGYISYLVRALDYVSVLKDQGYPIAVVNMSLGTEQESDALTRAVGRATSRGILLVVAAGNNFGQNNDETPTYPANIKNENIISVAATNAQGTLASFSNYGPLTVDIAAPGANILSTVPVALKGAPYGLMDGTSMSAPHVAGVAALVAVINPEASASLIRGILLATVTPRTRLAKKTVSGGIVNAQAAVVMGIAAKKRYRLTGKVARRGRGLARVSVSLKLVDGVAYRRKTTTTSSGRFSFSDVPAGIYTLKPSRSGYTFATSSRRVTITMDKQVRFNAR